MKYNITKQIKRTIIVIIVGILLFCLIAIGFLHGKYINKENNLVMLTKDGNPQEIYILGTLHEYHFNRILGYSYLDIQNIIDSINPDLLLLEVDQEAMNEYGVIKSPIEMVPLWCFAVEQGIDVKGVDWFEVTEDSRSWTTSKERDDRIFKNILSSINGEPTVLIILGSVHRMEQTKRFENEGYVQQTIENKANLFVNADENTFTYPTQTVSEINKQLDYWQTTVAEQALAATLEGGKGRKYWLDHYQELTASIQNILDGLIETNKLYW